MTVQSPRTVKSPITPLSADIDLDVAWKRTISKCQSITNWNLDANTNLSVDDVIAKIKPAKQDGKSESRDQAKRVFRTTLECIQRFGQIAAQAASMVFGPSQQCFNAVNFVIIAAQEWIAVFENLATVMERVSAFFERLRIYMDDNSQSTKLDPRLRITVYRVLDHFLVIMGNAHKITSGFRGKVKLGFKIAIGEDGGVKDALSRLETLVSEVTRMEISYIVRNLSDAAKNVRSVEKKLDSMAETLEKAASSAIHLQEAEDRRSDADKEQKETAVLRKIFGIDEKREPWQDRQDELSRERIPGTGQWLLDWRFPSYARWSDPKETSLNLIAVRAQQNFGKSFLASLVVDDLLEKHRSNPRVCVAYYYFGADRDSGESRDSGKESLNKALKAIIWQLIQANRDVSEEFRKLVSNACENNSDLSKTERLWKTLITDHEHTLNATFFVVLDGFNEPEIEPGYPFANILSRIVLPAYQKPLLKLRIFLTGRPAGLSGLNREMEQRALAINLAPPEKSDEVAVNHNDILLFAEARLNDISFYRGTLESDDRDLKERVKTTLAQGVRGDYFTLKSKLSEIAKARDVDKVDEILRRADEDRAQIIERQIKQLNETLTSDEIEEVNEILIWVIAGFRWPSIALLENVLRLEARTNKLLGPLSGRIQERYSELFLVEGPPDQDKEFYIQLRSDEIEKFLCKAEEQTSVAGRDATRRLREGGFQEAEISLMERTIKTHLLHVFGEDGQDMFVKYGFSEFFDSKRGPSASQIHFRKDRAHVIIAKSCLVALCDYYDESEFAHLHEYGFDHFADHLKEQIDEHGLEKVDTVAKYDIGRKLVRLLAEQTFIDTWLDRWMETCEYWAYEQDLVDALLAWFKDSGVQKGLQDMPQEKKWLSSLMVEGTPSAKVLENIAFGVLRWWPEADEFQMEKAFVFMLGHFKQLHGKELTNAYDASAQDIEDLAAWARAKLPMGGEAQWQFRLGQAMQLCGHLDEALSKYRKAAEMDPGLWRARELIAMVLGLNGENRDAISTLTELMKKENERLDSDAQYTHEYWDNILPSIVTLNLRLKETTAAEDVSKKLVDRVMKQDSFDGSAQFDVKNLIYIQGELGKHSEIVQLLDDLNGKTDFEEGNWLIKMMYTFYSHSEFHNALLDIAKHTGCFGKIRAFYEAAIDIAISTTSFVMMGKQGVLLMRLRTELARLLWNVGTTKEQRQSALDIWEEILRATPDEDDENFPEVIHTQRICARSIGPALVTAAIENDPSMLNEDAAEECLQRLEALQNLEHATVRQPMSDIRVPLARMLCLMKRPDSARQAIRDYVGVAVNLLEESSGQNMTACDRLVNAFLAVEDDVNATAVFTLFDRKPTLDIPDWETVSGDSEGDTIAEEPQNVVSDELEAPLESAISVESSRVNALPSPASKPSLTPLDTSVSPETTPSKHSAAPQSAAPQHAGKCSSIGCNHVWKYPSDIYACRDCSKFLCPSCYEAVRKGTGTKISCPSSHSHLHIPEIDEQKFIDRPSDIVWVGGEDVPLQEWLDSIKNDWGLEQRSVTARSRWDKAIAYVLTLKSIQNDARRKKQGSHDSNN